MRKVVLCILCIFTVLACHQLNSGNKAQASAQSEIAMELTTGAVLLEGNADARRPMASTTKILTAIIILEDCDLDEVIQVPDEAVGVEGSSIYLKKGEKIDIIPWSENPLEFIAKALSPAKVISVTQLDGEKTAMAVVPDDKLSLAIGKDGQNARLAVRLTGWKIDVKSESAAKKMGFGAEESNENSGENEEN